MAGFENDVLLLKNINFDYTSVPPHSGIVVANGQVLIGTTTNPDIAMVANTLTAGTGISITNGPGTITIAASGGGVAVDSFDVQAATAPGTDPVVPTAAGLVTVNGAAVANHSVVLETRSRAANAYNLEVQYATSAAATDATKSGVAHFDSADFTVDASGFVTLSASVPTTDLHTARYIVSAGGTADGANYTTIATAYAAAVTASAGGTVPQTVFIQPGTYTENITLSPSVDLTAFVCDSDTPTVIISGKITASYTGTSTISNIALQTNGDFALVVSSANATNLDLYGCKITALTGTGISVTNTGGNTARLHLYYCGGGTSAGAVFFNKSGNCELKFWYGVYGGPGNASIISNTGLDFNWTFFANAITNSGALLISGNSSIYGITTSSTGSISSSNSFLAVVTLAGTGTLTAVNCYFGSLSPTVTALVVGAGTTATITDCTIDSSNAAAISGAGTLNYAGLTFINTSSSITVTTQVNLKSGPSETFGSSNSGGTNTITATNTSNTASSNASIVATVGGTSAADAFYQAIVSGTTTWSWGVDNSDSDAYVLSASATPGTTNVMRAATTGEITFPLQSAFSAYNANTASDVTGDGTNYTCQFDTELYDQNSDFATNTFTAPVTGKYSFQVIYYLSGLLVAHTSVAARLNATGKTINMSFHNPFAVSNTGIDIFSGSVMISMTATDTVTLSIIVSGGTKVVDWIGGAITGTPPMFSGKLVC